MSDLSNAGFVTSAAIPMALLGDDGAAVATSPAWDRLFDARPPRTDVAVQVTPAPGPGCLLLVATDQTVLRAEAIELQERIDFMEWQALSLSTFAKAIANTPIILFSMDPAGVTTMSDGKGLELLGLRPGERVGVNELDATAGTKAHDELLRAFRGETFRVLAEPSPGVHFETWYTPLRDENDQPDGVLGLAIDATERVRSEQRLVEKAKVIERQAATIRELAAPVIKVWDEIVCLPIIGSVDAVRATDMMERLLQSIVKEQARFAVLDLTGVEAMDTSTVNHVIRMLSAARMLGVQGVLSGARPSVAHTIVSLGVDLDDLRMVRTLHDALSWCLKRKEADEKKRRSHR
jgi:rsbT co-antagonist protein RsbR